MEETMDWRVSTFCANSGCVGIKRDGGSILFGDTKNPNGSYLSLAPQSFADLIRGIKAGEFEVDEDE